MLEKLQKLLLICFSRCSASRLNWFYIIIYPGLTSVSIPLLRGAGDKSPAWQHIFPFRSVCNGTSRLTLLLAWLRAHPLPHSCGLAGNLPQPAGSGLWLPARRRRLPWQGWQDPPGPARLQLSQGGRSPPPKRKRKSSLFYFLKKTTRNCLNPFDFP